MLKIAVRQLRPEMVNSLRQHGQRLMNDWHDDVVRSLHAEGVVAESCVVFQVEDKWYAVGVMAAPGEITRGPDTELEQEHRRVLEAAILNRVRCESVYEVDAGLSDKK